MAFELIYTRRAARDIERLDELTRKRIRQKLEHLREDPYREAKKLGNPKIGQYRCRVGNFRIIFDVEGDKVIILRVGHRREIYR